MANKLNVSDKFLQQQQLLPQRTRKTRKRCHNPLDVEKSPRDIFSKPNVKRSVPTTMITMSTRCNAESIPLAPAASAGQPGPLRAVVGPGCLPRSEGLCRWQPDEVGLRPKSAVVRATALSQLFGCTSRLLEDSGLQNAFSMQLLEHKRVRWTAKEEAMSPLGTANIV